MLINSNKFQALNLKTVCEYIDVRTVEFITVAIVRKSA